MLAARCSFEAEIVWTVLAPYPTTHQGQRTQACNPQRRTRGSEDQGPAFTANGTMMSDKTKTGAERDLVTGDDMLLPSDAAIVAG